MSADNVALIQGIYDAFATGDGDAIAARMSDGIVWNEADDHPYADRNPYVGPQAIGEGVFYRCATEWDGFRVELGELIDGGDTIVALGHYAATHPGTGNPLRAQLVHVWRIVDGKAAGFQQYTNTLDFARAAGAAA